MAANFVATNVTPAALPVSELLAQFQLRRSFSYGEIATTTTGDDHVHLLLPTAKRSLSLEAFFGAIDASDHEDHNNVVNDENRFKNLIDQLEVIEADADDLDDDDDSPTVPVHICLPAHLDPLTGVLKDDVELVCCSTVTYLKLHAESLQQVKRKLTPFGRKMHAINTRRGYRLNKLLASMLNWPVEQRHARLQQKMWLLDVDHVEWQFGECAVCFAPCRFTRKPPCCHTKAICHQCWQNYVRTTAHNSLAVQLTGSYELKCFACSKFVPYSEALSCTCPEDMNLIRPPGHLSVPAVRCPVCLEMVPNVNDRLSAMKKWRRKKGGLPYECKRCKHHFCGACGLADHPKLTCKQLTATDFGLEKWARQKHRSRPEFPNGRRCPSCRIPLSHTGGCPHMTCPCGAEFCYSCGRRYGFEFVHQIHMSEQFRLLPFVSCSKLWKSKRRRLLVHSLISLGLIVGVAPLAIGLAPIAIPVGLGFYFANKHKH